MLLSTPYQLHSVAYPVDNTITDTYAFNTGPGLGWFLSRVDLGALPYELVDSETVANLDAQVHEISSEGGVPVPTY